MTPIPNNLEKILNSMQLSALRSLENHGWRLCFIRREGLAVPVPVVIKGTDRTTVSIIDAAGNLNTKPAIRLRVNPEVRV